VRFWVRVHPRAGRERWSWDGEELELWITQPPVEDAANGACLRLVAAWLRVPASRVRLLAGRRSRRKLVEAEGPVTLPPPSAGDAASTTEGASAPCRADGPSSVRN